jgi:hypothetical protein
MIARIAGIAKIDEALLGSIVNRGNFGNSGNQS